MSEFLTPKPEANQVSVLQSSETERVGTPEKTKSPVPMSTPSVTESICAIIVTYFPTEELRATIAAIQPQVSHVLIVDNSSQPSGKRVEILDALENAAGVSIVRSSENLGIATALNMGVTWAKTRGYGWVLTLDQDTICEPNMVGIMLGAYRNDPDRDKIAILAPVHFDRETNHVDRKVRHLKGPIDEREIVMTSGNLIPMRVFDQIGLYDDDFFIEYVDTDFSLRARQHGLRVTIVRDARMGHRLGDMRVHRVWPRWAFFSHNYKPVRRYYRARNRLILYRRYKSSWILRDQNFALRDFVKILLVETEKWNKIKATIKGTFDALLGRLGRYEGATHSTPKASRYYVEMREEIVPLLPKFSARVLDFGCGAGITSGVLKRQKRFGWVCGVEGNPTAAIEAGKVLDQVLIGDIEKMDFPFPDSSFDTVLTLDILEHLVDPWKTLAHIHRLLKPGGRLIISIPNLRHYSVTVPLILFGDFRYQQEFILDSTHIRFFTKKTIIRTLETAGFEIEVMDYTGAKYGMGARANKLTLGLFKEFFIFQNLIACKKV